MEEKLPNKKADVVADESQPYDWSPAELAIVSAHPVFEGLTLEECKKFLTSCLKARPVTYHKPEYVYRKGEDIRDIHIVLDGTVRIVREDIWGNMTLSEEVKRGGSFGTIYACTPGVKADDSALVYSEDAVVLSLEVKRMLTLCSNACAHHIKIVQNLVAVISESNLFMRRKLTYLSLRTTREKLLAYLHDESARVGSVTFDIPFNRQQLADYLSVNRSAMSVELSRLKEEGVIDYAGRHHFTLLQEDK